MLPNVNRCRSLPSSPLPSPPLLLSPLCPSPSPGPCVRVRACNIPQITIPLQKGINMADVYMYPPPQIHLYPPTHMHTMHAVHNKTPANKWNKIKKKETNTCKYTLLFSVTHVQLFSFPLLLSVMHTKVSCAHKGAVRKQNGEHCTK